MSRYMQVPANSWRRRFKGGLSNHEMAISLAVQGYKGEKIQMQNLLKKKQKNKKIEKKYTTSQQEYGACAFLG